jgi:hypothetical protein
MHMQLNKLYPTHLHCAEGPAVVDHSTLDHEYYSEELEDAERVVEHSTARCDTPDTEIDFENISSSSWIDDDISNASLEPNSLTIDISPLLDMPCLEYSIASGSSQRILRTPYESERNIESVAYSKLDPILASVKDDDVTTLVSMMERLKLDSDTWSSAVAGVHGTPHEDACLETQVQTSIPLLAGLN